MESQLCEVTQRPSKRLLGGVLGIFTMAEHPIAEPKHLAAESVDQIQHGLLVTGQAATNQLAEIVSQRCILDPRLAQKEILVGDRIGFSRGKNRRLSRVEL